MAQATDAAIKLELRALNDNMMHASVASGLLVRSSRAAAAVAAETSDIYIDAAVHIRVKHSHYPLLPCGSKPMALQR
jgi:hypothetical protein